MNKTGKFLLIITHLVLVSVSGIFSQEIDQENTVIMKYLSNQSLGEKMKIFLEIKNPDSVYEYQLVFNLSGCLMKDSDGREYSAEEIYINNESLEGENPAISISAGNTAELILDFCWDKEDTDTAADKKISEIQVSIKYINEKQVLIPFIYSFPNPLSE